MATPDVYSLPKKSKKYVIRPKQGRKFEESVSIGVLLRDFLKLATNEREATIMLNNKDVLVNQKVVKDKKFSAGYFDVISIKSINKNYTLLPSKHKFNIQEISPEMSQQIFLKITNILPQTKNKQQIVFNNGYAILSERKVKVGDTAIIDAKAKKIKGLVSLKEGALILSTKGAHIGQIGRISKIETDIVLLDNSIKTIEKNIIVVPEEYASIVSSDGKSENASVVSGEVIASKTDDISKGGKNE